jgi:hypothetical protein
MAETVAASERRRALILQHRDKLAKTDIEFLQEAVPYVAELPAKAEAIFSRINPLFDDYARPRSILRAPSRCVIKHESLREKSA